MLIEIWSYDGSTAEAWTDDRDQRKSPIVDDLAALEV
jgi:hypothetical protein